MSLWPGPLCRAEPRRGDKSRGRRASLRRRGRDLGTSRLVLPNGCVPALARQHHGVETAELNELGELLDDTGTADANESGLANISSPAFVIRDDAAIVAACGWQVWPAGSPTSVPSLGPRTGGRDGPKPWRRGLSTRRQPKGSSLNGELGRSRHSSWPGASVWYSSAPSSA